MCFGAQQADFWRDCAEAVGQAAMTRLRLWSGEWFIDTSEGTPWTQAVLGTGRRKTIEPALRARILGTQGVTGILDFSIAIDEESRTVKINVTIDTIYGQVPVQGVL